MLIEFIQYNGAWLRFFFVLRLFISSVIIEMFTNVYRSVSLPAKNAWRRVAKL